MIDPPKPLTDIAKAIRKQLRDGNAERRLGLSEWDVAFLANRVLATLPKVRPPDVEQRGPRTVRERALAVAGNRAGARPKPGVPDHGLPPTEPTGGMRCEAKSCSEASVGWRLYARLGWLPVCVRHVTGAGADVRRLDSELGGSVAVPGGVVAGLGVADGSPGASVASEGRSGASGAGAS